MTDKLIKPKRVSMKKHRDVILVIAILLCGVVAIVLMRSSNHKSIIYPHGEKEHSAFAWSMAADDGRVVVGAFHHRMPGYVYTGAAYIYEKNPLTNEWDETKFTATPAGNNDDFGSSVAIDGDTVVVGAPGQSFGKALTKAGCVYIYKWDGATWQETQLRASDEKVGKRFGTNVAVSGDKIIVGNGYPDLSMYSYVWDGGKWIEIKLSGVSPYYFAIDGDTLVAEKMAGKKVKGKIYIYNWDGTSWKEDSLLVGRGYHNIAMSGDVIVMGKQGFDTRPTELSIFRRDTTTDAWDETRFVLVAKPGKDVGGMSVAVEGDYVAVGTVQNTWRSDSPAFFFKWDGAKWQQYDIPHGGSGWFSQFGMSVAIDGERVLVGDPTSGATGKVFEYDANELAE